jgi:very-short-patch-repair endonuclease
VGGVRIMNDHFARQLRKNMTEEERRLWRELPYRQLEGRKFRRQAPIGTYIVDFVCFEAKLVVELDGGQHSDAAQVAADSLRTAWLKSQGFRVLRFWNHQVKEDVESVLEVIWTALKDTPHPNPPPQGGREKTPHPNPPPQGGRETKV